jgi:hypothetical protein
MQEIGHLIFLLTSFPEKFRHIEAHSVKLPIRQGLKQKKPGCSNFWQPGYLWKIRGFPSLDPSGFGFISKYIFSYYIIGKDASDFN